MKCLQCGFENEPDKKFCTECGNKLALRCPECESELKGSEKFCGECGYDLTKPKEAPLANYSQPQSYTPKHLADKILQSKSALEGERKQVTVLFADVKGSMDLTEQLDPEEWHRILDRFFQILADGVHRFEGTINQYTGDGIMALFGAPIAHEDHAHRACYASLYLSEQLRRYANELRLSRGLNFAVRMGLNSGEVVVGKIGDDLRMDYTAQGHTVGLASRMEQIAEPGKVYLAQDTAKAVEGYFVLEDLGEVRVPGMGQPVRVSELRGVGMLRTRLDVSRARGFSRFVGRAEEMQALEAARARARERQAQVVGVVGEAGSGKSRLCYEFLERCRARGLATLEAHGVAHGKATPLVPILQLYRNYYGISDQDSDRVAREKIAGRLLLLNEAFREALPLQFEFLGVADPEQPPPRMDPEARQRQLFAVMKRVIQRTGQQQVTITLLEDLHWFDGGSLAFVEQFVDAVQGTRVLLVVTFRPEFHANWMQKSYYQQVPLMPLGAEAIRELLDDLLGSDPSLPGLAERIQERTAGNPFFIEEVVQSLAESGQLAGTRGAYHLARQVAEIQVPDTVQAVLSARIDRQGEREKQVLQMASVIGKTFSEGVLARIAELDLRASLEALKAAEFIYESSIYPQLEYSFKHPLTQEVAYGSQLGERRQKVHAAVARSLAEMESENLDERAALIAYHWEAAGDILEAVRWHRRAAEWIGSSDVAQAIRHWEKVRLLPKDLPESTETLALRVAACSQVLNLGWRVGMSEEEASTIFTEGRALAEHGPDRRLLVALLAFYAPVRGGVFGDVRGWANYGEAALEVASEIGDLGLQSGASLAVQCSLFHLGRLLDCAEVCNRMLRGPLLHDLDRQSDMWGISSYGWTVGWRGFAWAFLGRLTDGAIETEKAIELARQRDETELLVSALCWRSMVAELAGEPDSALRHAQRAVEAAEKMGLPWLRALGYGALGRARALRCEWRDATTALEVAATNVQQGRTQLNEEPLLLAYLAHTCSHLGDHERAGTTAERAVALARERSLVLYEIPVLVMLSRVLLRSEVAKARWRIQEALKRTLALVKETGARAFEPWVHEESAELARVCREDDIQQRELREAHRLYTEIGATGHAQRLATELGL